MVGVYADNAQQFLLVLASLTTVAFALPLFVTPLTWARVMQFQIPADTDLAVYFGRCLGAFVLIVEGLAFRAAITGVAILFTFQVLLAVFVLMILVHLYGALKGIQPVTETVEIAFWILLLLGGLAFFPIAASAGS